MGKVGGQEVEIERICDTGILYERFSSVKVREGETLSMTS